jgi:UMF1 family MFS transporter
MRARPRRTREVVAYCLFDFANSSYTTLIITVVFAVYFRDVVVGAADNTGDRLWGIANFIAMALVVLATPFLGALADYSGRRKRFLIMTTLQTVVATALLALVGPRDVVFAMALYVIATVGFEAGYAFYNAFLPDVSTPETVGRISGWAWAVGYVGGLACLVVAKPLIDPPLHDAAGVLQPAAVVARQSSFLLVAAFYLVFAMPAFLWLRESSPLGEVRRWTDYGAIGFKRVLETLSHLRRYRETAKFVVASLLFNDGITTIIIFSAIYATTTFGFESGDLVWLFVVLNVVAIPGAVVAGHLADRIGPKKTIILTLLLWIAVVIVGAMATSRPVFWAMATGAAIGIGSTQAVGRSFMAQISPPERVAEFFGFYVLSGKFASMFGPLIFGLVSAGTGSQRLAVFSLLPFFVAGLVVMISISESRAIRDAAAPDQPAPPA